ncbi:arabinogalactan endo-1,4-beta-galactosidase [Pholiota molesta]|nr:arabinogalactan endo-1,4-beta-galactosidase [Pholiota molesta]
MRSFGIIPLFLASLLALVPWISALRYHGADFSSLINLEESGTVYKDASSRSGAKFETILHNHGTNLRASALAYGAGMDIYVDLHYSDTWADPGKQAIPSGLPTDLAGLKSQINTYTKTLVQSFTAQGTPINSSRSIGNEINDGILWPTGQISVNGYSPLSQLLHSAASGVRAASRSTKTVVHLANGWDGSSLATSDVDLMGFSFYPFYGTGATLSALQSSLQAMVNKFARGQSIWVADIRDVLSAVSGGHGLGIVYWEPGWAGSASLGSGCEDNLLVDSSGTTRRSISMFANSM